MRTSLNNIHDTEKYLLGTMTPGEQLIFKAKLLIDPLLRRDTALQKKTYRIIERYGRKKLREEIAAVEAKMFNGEDTRQFQNRISKIFKK